MSINLRPLHSTGIGPNPEVFGHVRLSCAPAESRHPGARKLIAYCQSKSLGVEPCHQTALRPQEITWLLPYLFIAEPSGGTWRYRLGGTGLVERLGAEFTGKLVGEVFEPETAEMVNQTYRAVVEDRLRLTSWGRCSIFGIDQGSAEAVHLPLLARDGRTVLVFGGVFFD